MKVKICPYYMKYCDCDDEEYATCDLSSVYPRQTEEMFDTPFGSTKSDNPMLNELLDTRAIKPEKYAELREQDFDTWLDTILHEIIEQVNFDAQEVDFLGDAVWNGECPDGSPYPKQCAREDAYIQCIRQSNQLDSIRAKLEQLDDVVHELQNQFESYLEDMCAMRERICKITEYIVGTDTHAHIFSNFCGNCIHAEMNTICTCDLSGEIIDPDDASCSMFDPSFTHVDKDRKSSKSNQLDEELNSKPDREEFKHCPNEHQCANCMNYPF